MLLYIFVHWSVRACEIIDADVENLPYTFNGKIVLVLRDSCLILVSFCYLIFHLTVDRKNILFSNATQIYILMQHLLALLLLYVHSSLLNNFMIMTNWHIMFSLYIGSTYMNAYMWTVECYISLTDYDVRHICTLSLLLNLPSMKVLGI
jgi:hypothetical protein